MAEVLITLAIVGVVAAMTIPTLINNYQKKQTVTKLKQSYSILSNAVKLAQTQYGDISTWDISGIYGVDTTDETFSRRTRIVNFTTKYILPNIKVMEDYGYKSYSSLGNYEAYLPSTHTVEHAGGSGYYFMLSNGVLVRVYIQTSGCIDGTNPDGTCVKTEYRNIVFNVDVNGFNPPNTYGKDIFLLALSLQYYTFGFHKYNFHERDSLVNMCNTDTGSQYCGYLIFLDNWTISDDYPWF